MSSIPILLGISALAAGVRPFFQKHVLQKVNVLEFLSLQVILFVILAAVALWKFKTLDKVREFDGKTWIYFFGGIAVSLISLFIYFYLIKKERPALIVSIYMPLTLVFTVIAGWVFFKDKTSIAELVGIGLIIVGIVVMNIKSKAIPRPGFGQEMGEPVI